MFSILCPHCRTKLTVEEQWCGQTITCISCAKKLAVPAAQATEQPSDAVNSTLVINTSTTAPRRRKPIGNRIINTLLHLSITVATVYGGYYLITSRRSKPPVQAHVEQPRTPSKTTSTRQTSPTKPKRPSKQPEPIPAITTSIEPVSITVVETPVSPFLTTPTSVTLPSSSDNTIATLLDGLGEVGLRLTSNATELSLADNTVLWQSDNAATPQPIARLTLLENELQFQWLDSIPPEAETALRNSVVRLTAGEFAHAFCFRQPVTISPLHGDLAKPLQRIVSKCDHLPAPVDIHFELLDIEQLPPCEIEGQHPSDLQLRDQSTLNYSHAPGASTKFTMRKRGKIVLVEMANHYTLPSGDQQPMTIARGNSKLKELEASHQQVAAAATAINGLRNQLKELEKNAKAIPRSRATATEKAVRLRQLQAGIAATQQKIRYAERLLSQKLAIEADYQAIQQIAKLAQQLHEKKFAYRFFTVVDGHEIDLLLAK